MSRKIELAIIGYILADKRLLDVPEEAFADEMLRQVYAGIKGHKEKYGTIWDENTVPDRYVATYSDAMAHYAGANIDPYVEILLREYRVRLWRTCATGLLKGIASADDVEAYLRQGNRDLYQTMSEAIKPAYSHADDVMRYLSEMVSQAQSAGALRGLKTGMTKLDEALNGWQHGRTYVLGGLEKLGKTRFCVALASGWIRTGHPGIIFEMEGSSDDIHEMVVANRAGVETGILGTSRMRQYDAVLKKAFVDYASEPLYVDTTSSITPEHVRDSIIDRRREGLNVEWCIVDYVQRMVSGDDRVGKLEDVAKGLADVARETKVVMIAISQLSAEAEKREAAKGKRLPVYAFIKGSKGIREAADAIVVLDNPNRGSDGFNDTTMTELMAVVLQRRGKSDVWYRIYADLGKCRFVGEEEYQVGRTDARNYQN